MNGGEKMGEMIFKIRKRGDEIKILWIPEVLGCNVLMFLTQL